jgi:methylphosphotriester-DNA--protein-cysteine methyltransferase
MRRFTHVPRPPLSNHIEILWAYESYGGGHARERVLPNGAAEIVFLLDREREQPVVCGAHSEAFIIETATRPTLLGVHFKPGGALPFLKVPADELVNRHVALDALWGALASELRDRLLEAPTWAARFRVVERALLARLTTSWPRHPAVAFAVSAIEAAPHAQTIGRLTERIGLSPRRFIEVFAGEVGLTPKVFARVRRFQRVLAMIQRNEAIDWADVAVAGGYYDQAHLIHDFRAFSGINPTAYVRADPRERNHVPID